MLPPGERFSRDFLIDEVLERYDENRSETRKENGEWITWQVFHIDNARVRPVQLQSDSMVIHR
jgi:hypothetical protein